MKITAFSVRYYEDEMKDFEAANAAVGILCKAKYRAYDALYRHENPEEGTVDALKNATLYDFIRSLGFNSLYANVIEPQAKGVLQSQKTLQKERLKDAEADLQKRMEKISDEKASLERLKKTKDSLKEYAKTGVFPKPYPECQLRIEEGMTAGRFVKPEPWETYERRVEALIRRTKNRVAMLEEGLRRAEKKRENLKNLPPKRAIFGGRRLYRQKDAAKDPDWRERFEEARTKTFTVSGRKDSKDGNFLVRYDRSDGSLVWTLPDGGAARFENFRLPKRGEQWLEALSNGEGPVAYSFEKRTDADGRRYMIVKAAFDLPTDGRICRDLSDGCLSVDLNADRFAWSNLDADGEVVDKGEIRFDLDGASKGQIDDRTGRAAAELVGLAQKAKKPIVMENLDAAAMRRGMKYENPNRNRVISTFACQKMTEAIESRAAKAGYAVIKVNPAYTSFESKVLLMRKMGTSVHVGAAVMIGRRALGILQNPPKWADPIIGETRLITKPGIRREWKAVYAYMKKLKVKTHAYYKQIPVFKKKTELRKWLETA